MSMSRTKLGKGKLLQMDSSAQKLGHKGDENSGDGDVEKDDRVDAAEERDVWQ